MNCWLYCVFLALASATAGTLRRDRTRTRYRADRRRARLATKEVVSHSKYTLAEINERLHSIGYTSFPETLLATALMSAIPAISQGLTSCLDIGCLSVDASEPGEINYHMLERVEGVLTEGSFGNLCYLIRYLRLQGNSDFYWKMSKVCDEDPANLAKPEIQAFIEFYSLNDTLANTQWAMLLNVMGKLPLSQHNPLSKQEILFLALLFTREYRALLVVSGETEECGGRKLLGEGGFGKVYRCTRNDNSVVAVKEMAINEDSIVSILREIEGLQAVQGASYAGRFVQLKAVQMPSWNKVEIVLELLEGMDGIHFFEGLRRLTQRLPIVSNLPILAAIIKGLLVGLDQLHKRHILHGDLKLENIYFTQRGELKLIDLGLIYDLKNPRWGLAGTPICGPPEITANIEQPIGVGADYWTMGILLIEALIGKALPEDLYFKCADSPSAITSYQVEVDALIKEVETILKGTNPSDFSHVIDFLHLCLQADPSKRPNYQTLSNHLFIQSAESSSALSQWTIEAIAAIKDKDREKADKLTHGELQAVGKVTVKASHHMIQQSEVEVLPEAVPVEYAPAIANKKSEDENWNRFQDKFNAFLNGTGSAEESGTKVQLSKNDPALKLAQSFKAEIDAFLAGICDEMGLPTN